MELERINQASAGALADLMDSDPSAAGLWRPGELSILLHHRLSCPVPAEWTEASAAAITFGQLLHSEHPSVNLLRQVARFAAESRHGLGVGMPPEVATLLYCGALAAGRVRCGQWILVGPEQQVAGALDWGMRQEWAGESMRELFRHCREMMPVRSLPLAATGGLPPIPAPADSHISDAGWVERERCDVDDAPRIPGYQIIGKLGEGGMGVVWRAVQLSTGREVALKLLNLAALGSHKARQRFEREVELTARLQHPHIARLYDSGVRQGAYFYAMELIEGTPLDAFVSEGKFSRRRAVELMSAVCRAVQHAHERGVIHRDLKPSNILVTPDGQPHVLDFGLARALEHSSGAASVTITGEVAGTVSFMSPQQASGESETLDTRSDVYSLGAILYLLMTGRPPHETSGPRHRLMRRVVEEDVPRPRAVDRTIDSELEAVLVKALSRDPARRYASAGELANDLGRYLRGDPLSARPPTLGYFFARRARRYAIPLTVGATASALLLALAVYSYVRIGQEKAVAVRERRRAEAELVASELSEGRALAEADRWVESRKKFEEARQELIDQRRSTLEADLGLVNAYRAVPPPLNSWQGHNARVNATAISPDGRLVASASADKTVKLWEVRTGRLIRLLTGHTAEVQKVQFAPTGKTLLSGDAAGGIRLWDVARGQVLQILDHGDKMICLTYSPDGKLAFSGSLHGQLRIWDLQSGRVVHTMGLEPFALAFTPDGDEFLSCAEYESMELWKTRFGGRMGYWGNGSPSNWRAAAFSPDGSRVLAAHEEDGSGTLWLWEVTSQLPLRKFGPSFGTGLVAFSIDGKKGYASGGGLVRTWDLSSGTIVHSLHGFQGPLSGVDLSTHYQIAASGDADGQVYIWDLRDRGDDVVARCPKGIRWVALSPDSTRALVGGVDLIALVDLIDGGCTWQSDLNTDALNAAAFSPDDKTVLCALSSGEIFLLGCDSHQRLKLAEGNVNGRLEWDQRVAFYLPGGSRALTANGNGPRLWDLPTRRQVWSRDDGGTFTWGGMITPDGRNLLGVNVHGEVTEWDLQTGRPSEMRRLDVPHDPGENFRFSCERVAFSADATRILGACGDDLFLWDVRDGRRLKRFLGHLGMPSTVAISPNGMYAASGARDGSITLWDIAAAREMQTFRWEGGTPTCLVFSLDGRRLYCGGTGGVFSCFDLDRPQAYREFEPRLHAAQAALRQDPHNRQALGTLAGWYAFRHMEDWAAELRSQTEAPEPTAREAFSGIGSADRR